MCCTSTMIQQRISAFYNAQCCGIAFEYQTLQLPDVHGRVVPTDHRFFLSFSLAGLGNFSPFNGALNGVPALAVVTRPTLVTGAAGFAGSHLLDLLLRRRRPPDRGLAPARRPPRRIEPGSAGKPWTCSIARRSRCDRDPAAGPRLSLRRRRARRPGLGRRRRRRGERARHAPPARRLRERWTRDARVLIPSSALVYRPSDRRLDEDHRWCRPARTASASWRRSSSRSSKRPAAGRCRAPVQSLRTAPGSVFAASGFARQIADIEAGRGARDRVGNLEARRDSPTCATRSAPTR